MQPLYGIISLTQKYGMLLAAFPVPFRPVEFRPERLIHLIIAGRGIPFSRIKTIPLRAPRHVSRQLYRFRLHNAAADKFFLLCFQIILFEIIPQGHGIHGLLRQIGKISMGIDGAQALYTDEQPVLMGENTAHS